MYLPQTHSNFDLLSVNETAIGTTVEEDPNSINHPDKLSIEATMINQNFSQQILHDGKQKKFNYPNPFAGEEADSAAAFAYRYRKWDFGNDIKLVARCELHAYESKRGAEQYITSFALNEWDSKLSGGVEWRKTIDAQVSIVLYY